LTGAAEGLAADIIVKNQGVENGKTYLPARVFSRQFTSSTGYQFASHFFPGIMATKICHDARMMNRQPPQDSKSASRVTGVVVTYHPDIALLENLRRLLEQISEVIVVDNATTGAQAEWVELAGKLPGVHLIRNHSNLGIAAALNTGIRAVLQKNCDWVATFDQDTAIPANYFERLFQSYEKCPAAENVGMIVPGGWSEADNKSAAKKKTKEPAWEFVAAALNSGSLITANVFEKAGYYDEALFIDYADADFCLRIQKYGFKILRVDGVVLKHDLGTKQTRNFFGIRLSFRIHAAWRYYYIVRNRLVLYRRFFSANPLWVLRDARGLLWELPRIAILENGRQEKLSAVFKGIRDGLLGRTGRHPDFPPRQTS
jgi:rhamnosyltransferase